MRDFKDRLHRVLVIGATPAGLAATNKLGEMGIPVTLVDSNPDLDQQFSREEWRLASGVSLNYAMRPGLLRILRNPRIRCVIPGEISSLKHTPQGFCAHFKNCKTFIDSERCVLCGRCAEVCPVTCGDGSKPLQYHGRGSLPGRPVIAKKGTSPCKAECPAHISVQGYVALAAQGRYREALQLIKEQNPLPAICGRICDHPCESVCTRRQVDEPVAIDFIKRFVADLDLDSETRYVPEIKAKRDEKVAIIGSGPAGLSCAYYLAIEGYQVTVFEKLPVLGGMLTVGIPAYRLPRDIIEAEIQVIRDLGVAFRTGVDIGRDVTIAQLREQGYKAFFLAIGAHECKVLGVEGESLEGVYPGTDFLRRLNLGEAITLGDRVAVVGGGNVAMDAVRSAKRLGAARPFIVYRRSHEEMPANEEEIEECREEGIAIMTLTTPTRILGENGQVKAIECLRMTLGEPDASGRRRPVPIPGSAFTMEVDAVIAAIGQESDWACLTSECTCTLSDWGTVRVDPLTMQTDDPDIFAGGDAVTGPKTVVKAIAAGKQAAISIGRFLEGSDLKEGREKEWHAVEDLRTEGYDRIPREQMPRLDPEARLTSFKEVQQGFSEDQVLTEAGRCLACGICSECNQCLETCGLHGAIRHDGMSEQGPEHAGVVIIADPEAAPPIRGEDVIRAYSKKSSKDDVYAMMLRGFAAAAEAMLILGGSSQRLKGHGLSFSPPDPQLSKEIRIGVFVCRCKDSLGWTVKLDEHLATLTSQPDVVHAEALVSACVPEGSTAITRTIREHRLTRVVLASCVCCPLNFICSSCTDQRSRLKSALFNATGISRSMVETCNLRGEALRFLQEDPELGFERFRGLIGRSIGRARHLKSLPAPARRYNFTTAVIADSEAAIRSALSLAEAGMEVFLFGSGERPLADPLPHPNIENFCGSVVKRLRGTVGNFEVTVETSGQQQEFYVGAVILGDASRRRIPYLPLEELPPRPVESTMQRQGVSGIPFFTPGSTSVPGLFLANPPGISVSERTKGTAAAILAASVMPRGPRQNKGYTVVIDDLLCRGCGRCIEICPYHAVSFAKNAVGGWHAVVDQALCKGCGNCIAVCPSSAADCPYRNRAYLEQMIDEVLL